MPRYAIIPDRSTLAAVASSSVHPIHGGADRLTGWVEAVVVDGAVDTAEPATARVELAAADLHAGNALANREIRKRLEIRRYPAVTAQVRKVGERGADGRYEVHGELSLRGVTHPVRGTATLHEDAGGALEITGELALDVRDFGLDPPSLFGLRVHPDVAVTVRLHATPEQ